MKILVSGASGLVGTSLCFALAGAGHEVIKLKHAPDLKHVPPLHRGSRTIFWNPEAGQLDPNALDGVEAVINLAGESIAGRWSAKKKAKIFSSRILSTRLLAKNIAIPKSSVKVFINASSIGYYGSCADQILTEGHPPGHDFLAEVCQQWEAELSPAQEAGVRTVILRSGIILSTSGGALKSMLTPFKMGLGGQIGSGEQYMSWISIYDTVGIILFLLENKNCKGPYNVTSPHPIKNAEFTKTLGQILNRSTLMKIPVGLIHLLFGEMGDALFLTSIRAVPQACEEAGYTFLYPKLEDAIRHLLQKPS